MNKPDTRRYIARLLLVMWGLISLTNVVFRHAHRLPDGRIVSHAHLYAGLSLKHPFPNHHHSRTELAWLDCIGNAPFDAPAPDLVCPLPPIGLAPLLTYTYVETEGGQRFIFHCLRGPPHRLG